MLHFMFWIGSRVLRFCARNFVPCNALTFMGIASHLVLLGSCATLLLLTKVKVFCPVWTGFCATLFSLCFLCRFAYVLHLCHFYQRLTGMSSTLDTCSPTIFAQPSGSLRSFCSGSVRYSVIFGVPVHLGLSLLSHFGALSVLPRNIVLGSQFVPLLSFNQACHYPALPSLLKVKNKSEGHPSLLLSKVKTFKGNLKFIIACGEYFC